LEYLLSLKLGSGRSLYIDYRRTKRKKAIKTLDYLFATEEDPAEKNTV
jgi:hypothetical protein